MTVIIDALKAAQRERARRESSTAPTNAAPILVPLRSTPDTASQRRRMFVLVGLGIGLVALSFGAKVMLQSPTQSRSLPTVPPITSTILAEALADTGTGPTIDRTTAAAYPSFEPVRAYTAGVEQAPVVASNTRPSDTTTVLQGSPRDAADSIAVVEPRDAPRPGRLKISVENAGVPRATRLFADAVAAQRAGDIATARGLYDSVLVLTPQDADALNNLGVLLSAQREYSRALELLRRATSASPKSPGPWNNIGAVLHAQGKHSDAIAAFRRALALDADHPGAKVGLAQQYLAIHAADQARALLEEVVVAHPHLPEAHYTLGQVLEMQGNSAEAVRSYQEFVRVAPSRLASHVELVKRRIEMLSRQR